MNNISDSNKMIDKIIQESMEKFKSFTVENLQDAKQEFDYQSYYRNLISEKNT